jgi:hypothetical protein
MARDITISANDTATISANDPPIHHRSESLFTMARSSGDGGRPKLAPTPFYHSPAGRQARAPNITTNQRDHGMPITSMVVMGAGDASMRCAPMGNVGTRWC